MTANGSNLYAGTSSGILATTNNGNNWTRVSPDSLCVYTVALNGNVLWAGTKSGFYTSTNSGAVWTQTSLNNKTGYSLLFNGTDIWAGTNNGIYRSTNNGVNWTQNALAGYDVFGFVIKGNGILCATNAAVFRTTNNGGNWVRISSTEWDVFSLVVVGNTIIAGIENVFSLTDKGVYVTTNDGTNWIKKSEGIFRNVPVNAVTILNNYIFAGTLDQSVFRRPLNEVIGIKQISSEIPVSYSLEQNFPNPFNPSTTIKFSIPENGKVKTENNFVVIKVYNLLGREVATLVNEHLIPGTYAVTFDGAGLSSGLYYYKLTAGSYSETRKMILMK